MLWSCVSRENVRRLSRRVVFLFAGDYGVRLFSFVAERAQNKRTLFYTSYSIATSRCRKTEWLLCGAHASSVLAARFPLVSYAAAESSRLPSIYSTDTSWRKSCFFPLALYAVAKSFIAGRALKRAYEPDRTVLDV